MGRPEGIEPSNAGATIRCVNPFATTAIYGRGSRNRTHIDGFGDRSFAVKLYPYKFQIKWWRGADSNCRTLRERIYSPPRLATSLPLQHGWWLGTESNRRHTDFQSVALPTELPSHSCSNKNYSFI